jgi:hypothetical protein
VEIRRICRRIPHEGVAFVSFSPEEAILVTGIFRWPRRAFSARQHLSAGSRNSPAALSPLKLAGNDFPTS